MHRNYLGTVNIILDFGYISHLPWPTGVPEILDQLILPRGYFVMNDNLFIQYGSSNNVILCPVSKKIINPYRNCWSPMKSPQVSSLLSP